MHWMEIAWALFCSAGIKDASRWASYDASINGQRIGGRKWVQRVYQQLNDSFSVLPQCPSRSSGTGRIHCRHTHTFFFFLLSSYFHGNMNHRGILCVCVCVRKLSLCRTLSCVGSLPVKRQKRPMCRLVVLSCIISCHWQFKITSTQYEYYKCFSSFARQPL